MASSKSAHEEAEIFGVAGPDAIEDVPDDNQEASAPQQNPNEEMPITKQEGKRPVMTQANIGRQDRGELQTLRSAWHH